MTKSMDLMPVDRIEITTLMDNYSDLLLPSTETMKHFPLVDREGRAAEPPLAGHGLSLLIETHQDGEKHTTLMDAGFPTAGIQYNWRVRGASSRLRRALGVSLRRELSRTLGRTLSRADFGEPSA